VLKKIDGSKKEVAENYMMKRFMVCGHNLLLLFYPRRSH
jgi:hypothetical protein